MNELYENGVLVSSEPLTQEQIDHFQGLIKQSRRDAYTAEADPLFFKAQRGEATMEEWAAKVAEIKARYPTIDVSVS